ncbi:hypothetical protein KKA09_03870, partial [Patescibacteria group bacterium]|nr:hypothetical protein [Patescibacteria group bacterium]
LNFKIRTFMNALKWILHRVAIENCKLKIHCCRLWRLPIGLQLGLKIENYEGLIFHYQFNFRVMQMS